MEKSMTKVFVVTTMADNVPAVVGVFLTMEAAKDFAVTLPLHDLDAVNIWPQEVK